jgi:hypothetical protein
MPRRAGRGKRAAERAADTGRVADGHGLRVGRALHPSRPEPANDQIQRPAEGGSAGSTC